MSGASEDLQAVARHRDDVIVLPNLHPIFTLRGGATGAVLTLT